MLDLPVMQSQTSTLMERQMEKAQTDYLSMVDEHDCFPLKKKSCPADWFQGQARKGRSWWGEGQRSGEGYDDCEEKGLLRFPAPDPDRYRLKTPI